MTMTTPHRYTFGATLDRPVEAVRPLVADALRAEGFGVLTEIDVQATLREKLGVERAPYLILGACNPHLANRALEADPSIGALLPCNVVLRAVEGGTEIEIMDPLSALGVARAPGIEPIAEEANARLRRVLAALEASTDR
jgi:uncharacterized protein (DUF302 family)